MTATRTEASLLIEGDRRMRGDAPTPPQNDPRIVQLEMDAAPQRRRPILSPRWGA